MSLWGFRRLLCTVCLSGRGNQIEASNDRERKCADTIGTVVPVMGWPFPMLKYINIFFKLNKYTEAILSNSTQKLLRFETTKMLISV